MGGAYHCNCIISEFSCGFPLDPILTLTAKAVGQQNKSGKWPKKDMDQSPQGSKQVSSRLHRETRIYSISFEQLPKCSGNAGNFVLLILTKVEMKQDRHLSEPSCAA